MKIISKVTATVLIIIMLFFNSMALAVENVTGTVNTETLRLRKEPSAESIVLDLLSKDDKVEILEEKDGWYKVKFKDYTGYVSKEFITTSGEVKSNTSNENETKDNNQTEVSNTEGTVEIKQKEAKTSTDVKIYMLPLINSNVVSNAKQNTKVTIVNIAGGWAYINTSEISGWIRLDKLSIEEANSQASNNNLGNTTESNTNNSENNNTTNNNETTTNQSEVSAKSKFQSKNAYIKASSVNVRSSATTNSSVITTLSQNTQIKLVGEENDWYKVEVNGKSGYILKTLVSDKKTETTSRSAVPTRTTTQNQVTNQENNVKKSENINEEANKEQTTQKEEVNEQQVQTTSSKGEEVVAYAKNYLGCKYVYAGSGPSVFDCSGFTMYVYKHFGYSMGHSAVTQASVGSYVPRSSLQPGDLVIFNNERNTSIGHVGIYVGGGNFIHASSGSGKVVISSLSNAYYNARYVTGRRIF